VQALVARPRGTPPDRLSRRETRANPVWRGALRAPVHDADPCRPRRPAAKARRPRPEDRTSVWTKEEVDRSALRRTTSEPTCSMSSVSALRLGVGQRCIIGNSPSLARTRSITTAMARPAALRTTAATSTCTPPDVRKRPEISAVPFVTARWVNGCRTRSARSSREPASCGDSARSTVIIGRFFRNLSDSVEVLLDEQFRVVFRRTAGTDAVRERRVRLLLQRRRGRSERR
jgi:hypothetical protein